MPGVLLVIALALVLGAYVRPRSRALAIVSVLAVLNVVTFVWAITDGKGDDPWSTIFLALGGAAIALALVPVGARMRRVDA